jgi:D-glycero-alpha-D-manno-heptose-7-phosphate kinase
MKMILKRIQSAAPIRVCDIGGWTDTWFAGHGAVFNIAVSPYVEVQITVFPRENEKRVTLVMENFNDTYSLDPDNIVYDRHPLIEAAIDTMDIPGDYGLNINIFSEAPSGASVGTSAAVCVALIGALDALTPGRMTPHEIAELAHKVETERLGWQSGIQDQLASAYGGINFIHMHMFPHSSVTSLDVSQNLRWELERRLSLIYIGSPHNSSEVHKMVIADLGESAGNDSRIETLRTLAVEARRAMVSSKLDALGQVMNRNSGAQEALHPGLVCEKFEEVIEIANFYNALGCKINGAGGDGGSITILGNGDVAVKRQMISTLQNKGYSSIPVFLSPYGIRVWNAFT